MLFIYCKVNAQQQDTTGVLKPAVDRVKSKQLKTVVVTGQKNRSVNEKAPLTLSGTDIFHTGAL
jgi:hypothetical protein